jgi:uncharacterized membrane-anchored protein YitT (DUF2179 family)
MERTGPGSRPGRGTAVPVTGPRTGSRLREARPIVVDYLLLTAGAVCVALAVDLFLVPNNVVAGGVTGIAIILRTLLGTPIGVVTLAINVPLFLVGFRHLGGATFGARTIYATVALSLAIDALSPLSGRIAVRDPLLYTFYGGLLDGLGLGLVFRARGTTGGSDIIARLLNQRLGVRLGQGILVIDALVFATAGAIYGATPALYALLVAFISSRMINIVQEGVAYARAAVIVTGRPDEIQAAVLHDLGRGVTLLEGRGGYTSAERPVLLCVVARSEESYLKELIERVDPRAFVVITEATDVLGEGFRSFGRG